MRIAIALPGIHRVNRGAETAFQSLGAALADRGHQVTLFGTGDPRPDTAYTYVKTSSRPRERFENWPFFPPLRDSFRYEELTWTPGLVRKFRPRDFDVTITCSYPFTNLALRIPRRRRPPHVYVTENGDWPAQGRNAEYRWFSCDGIVCTNATFHERNKDLWKSALIPNGVDLDEFSPGEATRDEFGLPEGVPVVLMVSALNQNKRVDAGIEAVASIPDAVLVVAGDGPMRDEIDAQAEQMLPDRYHRLSIDSSRMPRLYRSADVVFHPTLMESFGNVYVEALASGTPLVAHRSEHTEWILGDSPLLVDTLSAQETAAALRLALDTPKASPSEAADRAARFNWSAVAERYETFLSDVVNDRKAS